MVRYDMICVDGHVFEMELLDFATAASYLKSNPACAQCYKPGAKKYFKPSTDVPIIYNCGGFYGNVPTADAHATGQI